MLKERFFLLEEEIAQACERSHRSRQDIRLQLATKTQSTDTLKTCYQLGYTYFGENRLQELQEKQTALKDLACQWDFIGHLQSKKVKEVVGNVGLIQSLDRDKLAHEIEKRAKEKAVQQEVLIEVNTSGEESKSGISPNELNRLIDTVLSCDHIKIKGLMTIATNSETETLVRSCFQALFKARESLATSLGKKASDLELSMGMSNDFVWAIEEGATILRLGSRIFGQRT